MTIYEFDPSTLETVGAPFEGHTNVICGLTLSFDGVLLASASKDDTINLWAFESRQLLASFDVQKPSRIIISPDSRQLAYTTWDDINIYICNTPSSILASIRQPGQGALSNASAPHNPCIADLLNTRADILIPSVSFIGLRSNTV
ncbi:hypothetical protein DEU56DRAFT_916066 [Suillus clintonianus]|uniref:uncharacterized protein n=1 Tax=Suillus clintonianus TaxID=1904413 RepID=UPI001B86C542|nr:uncharacterized protein DEU56DRAFT_916066 [Suillus clintonianus]KAG2126554.1 hypothetical protein DEU56DRAFT_916066 [Suillus clintonianus]